MLHTSGTIHHMIVMIDLCKMMYLQVFFFFFHLFKILISQVVGGGGGGVKRAKKDPESEKLMSVVLYISGTIHHLISYYVAHM